MELAPERTDYELPQIVTESEYRKFNKQLVTRQLPLAQGCLHKFNPDSPPRINCDNCFFVWFNSNKERVEMFHNRYKNDKQGLIAEYGNNTVKQFNRFMATILKLREEKKVNNNGNEGM